MDQHLKVVREVIWEARAKWQCLGEELRVIMGKLQVRECDIKYSFHPFSHNVTVNSNYVLYIIYYV